MTLIEQLYRCLDRAPGPTDAARRQAAVMLALTDEEHPQLLLIRRSLGLSLHPGEIALPGGKFDPVDTDLRATALREAWEEVALPPAQFRCGGTLAPRISMSGLAVTAFVGVVPPALPLRADPAEVAEMLHVPLPFFADAGNLRVDRIWRGERLRLTARFQYRQYTIWGMTAGFIVDLVNRLYGAGLDITTRHAPTPQQEGQFV